MADDASGLSAGKDGTGGEQLSPPGDQEFSPSLVEMARQTDDLIEAMYLPGKTFVWGVQWHPEMSLQEESSRKIFEAFVGAVQQK